MSNVLTEEESVHDKRKHTKKNKIPKSFLKLLLEYGACNR